MKALSKFLSFALFPLFIPLYGIMLLTSAEFFSYYPELYIRSSYLSVALFGTVIPMTSILILYLLKIVSGMALKKKEDRTIPYILTAISYLLCSVSLYMLVFPIYVSSVIIAVAIALITDAIVSRFWKISAHMTGIGAMLGGALCICYHMHIFPIICLLSIILLCGLLATARLYLKAHTPMQVIAGFANGFCCAILVPMINWEPIFRFITSKQV